VPVYAYFPTTAVVSLVYMTEDGECDEVAVVGCEGVVGLSSFMGGRSTPDTATVQRGGWAFRLRARMVREEFEQFPDVMHLLVDYSLALSVQVAQTAVCNRHHMLAQRLCRRLLQGLDQQQDSELLMTQEQLAGLLGVRRESITTEAMKLQQTGVVRYTRGHIRVLDRPALERRACECYAVVKREFGRLLPKAAMLPAVQQMHQPERGALGCTPQEELGTVLDDARRQVGTLKACLVGASSDIHQRIIHLGETIDSGIAFSHGVVEGLQPPAAASSGLTASLQALAREFGRDSGVRIAADLEDADIDIRAQFTVYRLVQEFLDDSSKYAKASDARVVLINCGPDIMVVAHDNGKGFDAATGHACRSGLAGMRQRVEACGGQLTVSSHAGCGTTLAAVLPKHRNGFGTRQHASREVPAALTGRQPAPRRRVIDTPSVPT
jgi:CRP-like cAMP-binding protein